MRNVNVSQFDIRLFCIATLLTLLYPSLASAARQIESVVLSPPLVITGVPTPVTVTANIAEDPSLIAQSINLIEVDADGRALRIIGTLMDDGLLPDRAAGDNLYTIQFTTTEAAPNVRRFRVSVAYRGTLLRLLSDPIELFIDEEPFSTSPDSTKLVLGQGLPFAVDQVMVALAPGEPRSVAEAVATSVAGDIIGFAPAGNVYLLGVSATTPGDLSAVIAALEADARVVVAARNYLLEPFVINDLTILKQTSPGETVAFDKIEAIEAWDELERVSPPLFPVKIGLVDTGVSSTHPEFAGVNFGSSPSTGLTDAPTPHPLPECRSDPVTHGTDVAGIIGANNASAFGGVLAGVQMNGLLSGVPDATSPSGSKIAYTIESRRFDATHTVLAGINSLAAAGAQVVNLSLGMSHIDALTDATDKSCYGVAATQFARQSLLFSRTFGKYSGITFVVAAGNAAKRSPPADVSLALPAGIEADNVITVGATTISDDRTGFSFFGAGVDIAAPGEQIYAPTAFIAPLDAGDYRAFRGTSGSAPLTAGTVGLLLAVNPTLKPLQLRRILQLTGDDITTDKPLSGKRLNVSRAVKFVTQPVDVFVLVDMTGSFSDDLAIFKSEAGSIVESLVDAGLNLHFGLARFEDYPITPWGEPGLDQAYTRELDISEVDGNDDGTPDIIPVIQGLSTRSGFDGPESQLPALFQAATGAGEDVPPAGASPADIAPNQQANWRPASLRLIVLWTDAPFHESGDSVSDSGFPYPGPSFSETISALNAKDIKVLGIGTVSAFPDLTRVVQGSGALAPEEGVDCDGDGAIDLAMGEPIVCSISSTGVGISDAIIGVVLASVD